MDGRGETEAEESVSARYIGAPKKEGKKKAWMGSEKEKKENLFL